MPATKRSYTSFGVPIAAGDHVAAASRHCDAQRLAAIADLVCMYGLDEEALQELFRELDSDRNGEIDFEELKIGLKRLGVSPRKLMKGDYDEEAAERDSLRKA